MKVSFSSLLLGLVMGFLYGPTEIAAQTIRNLGFDPGPLSLEYYSIPTIDLDPESQLQVVVDQEAGQYLGHPTTLLLEDGKTLLCTYPKGHGRGPIVLKQSVDGGKTWSDRLPVPASWHSSLEVPTLFPTEDASGKKRILMFSGLYPARMAYSEDEGKTWSELEALGDWGGIVVMGDLIGLRTGKGHYMTMFHDDGRFISHKGRAPSEQAYLQQNLPLFTLYKSFSYDGGLNWTAPEAILSDRFVHLCEPGFVRSPDGKTLAVLLRENARRSTSHIIFSQDEGKTWSAPRPLPNALTGDRHQALYLPDGRLLISFRDNSPAPTHFRRLKSACKNCEEKQLALQAGPASPTHGDWVGWVGTFEDLVKGQEGQYRIRFKDNTRGSDCAYPALELLPDGTIVATTYGHWDMGEEPYILSVRFKIEEIEGK